MKPVSIHRLVRQSSLSTRAFAAAITALLASQSAHAAIQTWTNSGSNLTWDATSLNWTGAAWADGNDAVFGATGAGAITVSGTRILKDLTISAAGYSFTGGTLSLTNNTATNNTWLISNDTNIASAVLLTSNAAGLLSKTGTGKLLLSGAVSITGNNSFFSSTAGTVEFSGGLTATNTGISAFASDILISGGTNVLSGTTARKGIVIGGGGTFTVSGGATTAAALNAANGSSGTYTQTNGFVTIKSDTSGSVAVLLGAGGGGGTTSTINLDGGTLTALGMAPSAGWLGTSTINLNGGTFRCFADNTNLFNTNVAGSGAGSIFVKSGGVIINTNTFAVTQSQALLAGSPSGGLTKSGAGTLTLSGTNTYTGLTDIQAGTLALGASNVFANASTLKVSGGTLSMLTFADTVAGVQLTSGSITGSTGVLTSTTAFDLQAGTVSAILGGSAGAIKSTAGTVTLSGVNTYTGLTDVQAGMLALGVANVFADTSTIKVSGGTLSMLTFADTVAGVQLTSGSITGSTGVLTSTTAFDLQAGSASAILGGSAGATKSTAGTVTLSGVNSYTGTTAVNGGTLIVSGSIGNSAVTVSNTGTILASGATGTIGSSVTVNSGAILAAGNRNAAGTATVNGATTMNNGSIFSWDINSTGTGYDKLVTTGVTGEATAGDALFQIVAADATFSDNFWNTTQTWTNIFTTNGATAISNWADLFSISVVNSSFASITPVNGNFTISGNTLTWSAVPEPTTALAGLLMVSGLLRRRRN